MDSHSDLLVCPLCRRGYSLSGNNSSYRYPILLKCKHSICEYCFRDEAKNRRQVACRRCSFVSPIERNAKGKDKIDEYPIHFYIAGVLLQDKLNAIRATEAVDRIKFEEVESNSTQKFCDKCGKEKAIVKCDQCEDCFCDRCDVDIHTITTGARKHNRKRISTIPMSIAVLESQSLKCELHNTNIKYNCLDCNIKICSDCVLQSHKDHSYELLIQNNKLVLNKTLDLIDKAHELLPRFSYSQSKINEVFSKMEAKLSFNPRYSKTFETLFGSIQWCEFENRMKLKQFFNEQSEILKNYANQLLKRIDDIKEFVKLKAVLNETYLEANKVNLNETVSLLENTIATPWFISNDIFEAIDSFTFEKYPVVSEKFVELNLDKFPKLTLKSIEEVSENDLQNIDMTVKKNELAKNRSIVSPENDNDRLSVTSNHSNETNGSLGSRKKSCNKDHQEQFHLFCPSIGKNSPVVISHMLSPASFYVHLLKNNQWFAEFKKRCENWALKTPFVCNVKKGDCCLTACLNEANQKEWRRVKVNGFKDDGKIMVTYIDYGHSGVLSLEDLKHTSESIRKTLSFAFKCSLKDTFSIQQNWTALNTQECMQIIQSYKQWNLNVIRKVDNSFVVDLLMYSENTGSRPASLHTVLLHTKKSVLYNNACKHPDKIVNADSGSDTDSESPLVIADEAETGIDLTSGHVPRIEVTILKSDSPDNIAFSLPHLHLELNEMSKDIQEFYSNSENLVLLDRYELKIGTLCLVHFQRTNKWCRGKVQKIDYERESVTVNFFDEGVKDEMSMSKIYKLDHRFSLSHSGAMHACIGGIQPPCKKDTWPKVVCERLEKLLTDNKIFMSKLKTHTEVELKTRAKNLLAVDFWFQDCNELAALEPSVYDWKSVRDILIKEGLGCEDPNFQLATTTDAESSKEEDGNSTKKPMNIIRIDDDLEMLIENESEQSLCVFKPKTFWLPPSRPKRRMFETVATFVDMGAHIFITDSEENLKNMSEIRAEFESNFKMFQNSKKTNWTVGEICSAFYFGDKQYHRAEVVSIDATNNFLVEFIDYGNIETCTHDDLREYVCAPHIPKQVCKCRHKDLENLLSPFEGNEQFIKDILDFVHATIVDKTVTVEYIGDVNGFPLIDICCFGDKLVDLVGEEVKRRKLKEEDKYLLIENNDIVVEIKFTYFISSSDVIIEMPKQYMIHDEKFEEMLDNLQLISRNLNKLTEIIVDKPCIAHDHETKKWHRAKIFKINKNFTGSVLVYFVDKGTISEIDQSLLRETREDLMRLPVKTFICRLTNLHKYETNKPIDSLEQIKECFSTEKVYEALIKDKSDEGVLRIEIINNNRSLLCLEQ